MPTNEHEPPRLELEHLLRIPSLRRRAAAELLKRQPRTVREALLIPDVGSCTTRRLLGMGLLDDPEGVQPGTKKAVGRIRRAIRQVRDA